MHSSIFFPLDAVTRMGAVMAERLPLSDVIENRPQQPDPYNRMGENIYWKTPTDPNFVPSGQSYSTSRLLQVLICQDLFNVCSPELIKKRRKLTADRLIKILSV